MHALNVIIFCDGKSFAPHTVVTLNVPRPCNYAVCSSSGSRLYQRHIKSATVNTDLAMIMHVIKVHGMVSGSSPGHFPPPTRPIGLKLIWSSSVCSRIGMCTLKKLGWGFANRLTFYASFLPCLHTFWHAIPTLFTFLLLFIFLFSC